MTLTDQQKENVNTYAEHFKSLTEPGVPIHHDTEVLLNKITASTWHAAEKETLERVRVLVDGLTGSYFSGRSKGKTYGDALVDVNEALDALDSETSGTEV